MYNFREKSGVVPGNGRYKMISGRKKQRKTVKNGLFRAKTAIKKAKITLAKKRINCGIIRFSS